MAIEKFSASAFKIQNKIHENTVYEYVTLIEEKSYII